MKIVFPKGPTRWIDGNTLFVSVPFTWNLPALLTEFKQRSLLWSHALVGGPAVRLMPNFFSGLDYVMSGEHHPGAIKRINPFATFTSRGCIRKCGFCAVPKCEGDLLELPDWPDKPVILDNNLLATSPAHFDRVIDRLIRHGWADFNQGLDARLLTSYHAQRISEIGKPMVRLALDNERYSGDWDRALETLARAGIAKSNIRSYALCGFDSGPDEAWRRCEFVERKGIKVLPQWFHELDALKANQVTEKQTALGWDDYERRRIMQWYYKRKKAVRYS
jgi:hypothetical protein